MPYKYFKGIWKIIPLVLGLITFSYLSNVDCPNSTTLLWWISWTIHFTFRHTYFQIIRRQVVSTKAFIVNFNSIKQKSKITARLITLLWGIVIKSIRKFIKNPFRIIPVAIGGSAYIEWKKNTKSKWDLNYLGWSLKLTLFGCLSNFDSPSSSTLLWRISCTIHITFRHTY